MVKFLKVASACGFCEGVECAIKKALDAVSLQTGRVFTDGELIHNPEVNADLYKKGVQLLAKGEKVVKLESQDTVVIRAHGITPQRRQFLKSLGCQIVDGTCKHVAKIASIIKKNNPIPVLFLGDRNHPEVLGVCGYAEKIQICSHITELKDFVRSGLPFQNNTDHDVSNAKKIDKIEAENEAAIEFILLCQSTLDSAFWGEAQRWLDDQNLKFSAYNTICEATYKRQDALEELKECDAVIVIGGKNSANTRRLCEKIKERAQPVFHVEGVQDLDYSALERFESIGITAGASTPATTIQEVYRKLSENFSLK